MNRLIIAIVAFTGILAATYALGHHSGYSSAEACYVKQINEQATALQGAMQQVRQESRTRLAQRESEWQQQLAASNHHIQSLLEKDHAFSTWYNSRAPAAVGDIIYLDKRVQQ